MNKKTERERIFAYIALWLGIIFYIAWVTTRPGEQVTTDPGAGIQWDEMEINTIDAEEYQQFLSPTEIIDLRTVEEQSYQLLLEMREKMAEMKRIMEEEFGVKK
jgi:hypothetical protein